MSTILLTVLERWAEDPSFRSAMRSDPVGAMESTGVALTDRDREGLEAVDWTLSDDELESLLSKAFRAGC